MKAFVLSFFALFCGFAVQAQSDSTEVVKGKVLNAADDQALDDVNIVNLNQVKGAITDDDGNFAIKAAVNDTLYFSYLGFKSIEVRVTDDWKKYGNVKIKMTEVGFALEKVTINSFKLTGYLEIDAKNIPIYDNYRYRISGLDQGYEAGDQQPGAISRTLSAIFNPADFLYNIFGNKPRQMRKLRKMKENDEIRNLLETKFDRETLSALLQVSKSDITKILEHCNYSKTFIKTANDLQILDAISSCYEDYKVLKKKD